MASSRRKAKGEEFKQEDVLQAVVIADSFNIRFAPITKHKPRALLPLANIPLLEYTLEFLCSAGIQEVIVFCCIHANQIKAYLNKSRWANGCSPMEIITIVSEDCLSVGDALRDIDGKSLITSDFVLVNGDMISNVKLKHIIEEHKARRLKEKTPIMTLLFKKAPPGHMTRAREDEVVIAIKPDNNRVLSYNKSWSCKKFDIPLEVFTESNRVQLRYDLLDTHISICSPHVPPLFTDNFDYSTRDDFIRGILVNEEILGNTIHVHLLDTEYAARVSNLIMYDSVSKDVLNRWVHPIVPDNAVSDQGQDKYSYGRHNNYLHKDVTLARGCQLHDNVMIGKGSDIGSHTVISQTVIGQNCIIGENVKLEGAYVWDNVKIEDNCVITQCLIDTGVHLKRNVTIQAGCVIGAKVILGPDITVDPRVLLTAEPPVTDEEGENPVMDVEVVGEEGYGYMYLPEAGSDDEEDGEIDGLAHNIWGMQLESEEEDTESLLSESEEDLEGGSPIPDETKLFYDEVIGSLERALVENIGKDNMILEVNSVKHAYGIQIKEVNHLLTKAIMDLPLRADPSLEATKYLNEILKNFKRFLPLLKNYIRSEESQHDCLKSLEEFCVCNAVGCRVIVKILHHLYETDILTEEVIVKWHSSSLAEDLPDKNERQNIKKQVEPFITWLQEAEEESEDDSDD